MEVKTITEDKRSLFFHLMDNLMFAFNYKGDKDKVKEIYWSTLEYIFSLFTENEFKQVQKEILFNCKWFPKPIELKDQANSIFKRFCSPQKAREYDHKSIDLLNYRELPLNEAREKMRFILYKHCEKEGVDEFVDAFDLNFRFFLEEDFKYFESRIKDATDITCDRIIEFFGKLREHRVEKRHEAIRGMNLPVDADKTPDGTVTAKMKAGIARIMNKQLPKLVMKEK